MNPFQDIPRAAHRFAHEVIYAAVGVAIIIVLIAVGIGALIG